LLRFGLKDVSELPSMEEFEKMAASELEEPEVAEPELASGEAAAAADFNPDLSTETDVETNGTGANHEAETAAQSTLAASDASASDAE
jgi:segregation and condensation protein B